MSLLEVKNLSINFNFKNNVLKAVDNVSFKINEGQTVGIVGESGSGKSVLCYSLLQLTKQSNGYIKSGEAKFNGKDLFKLSDEDIRKIRGKDISIIFQDPMTSLNPYLKISTQLIEPLMTHINMTKSQALKKAIEELELVGIDNANKKIHSYPNEFSGGMRQRVMIAMALITNPKILIADEPTTALDVVVQAQVMDLIKKRQKELGISVIFITHDLALASNVCDYINVMYAGRFLEKAPTKILFSNPKHAYTKGLQKSILYSQIKGNKLYTFSGTPPNLIDNISGCSFFNRYKEGDKSIEHSKNRPELIEVSSSHWVQDCPRCLT